MKNKLIWLILIISIVLLFLLIVDMLNINYIKQGDTQVEILGKKELTLKDNHNAVSLPHLNVKGIIKNVDSDQIEVELSEYSRTFLKTTSIMIKNEKFLLDKDQLVFIKFNHIDIDGESLVYSSVELFKYIEKIDISEIKRDFYVCKYDYGGFIKANGISFKYKGNVYFKNDHDFSDNNEVYFVNIKNGVLLIEEIKSLIFPFKVYNMINPQETRFYEILDIYTNIRSK